MDFLRGPTIAAVDCADRPVLAHQHDFVGADVEDLPRHFARKIRQEIHRGAAIFCGVMASWRLRRASPSGPLIGIVSIMRVKAEG